MPAKNLEIIVGFYGSGRYRLGTFADEQNPRKSFDFPKNEIQSCRKGVTMPELDEDQQNQLISQLISFGKKQNKALKKRKVNLCK